MKGMPLPFDFEGKGVLDFDLILHKNQSLFLKDTFPTDLSSSAYPFLEKDCILERGSNGICNNNSFGEPTSVLDSTGIPSRPTSSSTPSSSGGGGGGGRGVGGGSTDTTNPSPNWQHHQQDSTTATSSSIFRGCSDSANVVSQMGTLTNVLGGGNNAKFALEDWESVLSDDVSPAQEPSVLRWIMGGGDVEDHNKVLQLNAGNTNINNNHVLEFDFNGGFGAVDQENFCDLGGVGLIPVDPSVLDHRSTPLSSNLSSAFSNLPPPHGFNFSMGFDSMSSIETKPSLFNSGLFVNNQQAHQTQNPSFFYPLTHHQVESNPFSQPPQAKRHNPGVSVMDSLAEISKGSYSLESNHLQNTPHQLQFLNPHYQASVKIGSHNRPQTKIGEDYLFGQSHHQQSVVDQLFKAAESVQTGNLVLAHAILARLNHQVSDHNGKPFQRAAFYCKEALQLLLLSSNKDNDSDEITMPSLESSSPLSVVFKIGAYKSFSEISPVVQFANFTCNQAILESVEGFNRVHVVDFDIGYGGQWASLMQELALRSSNGVSLKIIVISSRTHDQLERELARENLTQFASEIDLVLEFEVLTFDSLPFHASTEEEGIVVNLPVGVLASNQLPVPMVLRFVKQLSPRIIVSIDRGCDRTDLPFANHLIHTLQSYSNLLESLEAVNMNSEALQKIERFLLQPGIERIVLNRSRSMEKAQHWRALLLSSGFSPGVFSNFAESQAECVIKRTHVRGFTVEKRQSCLVLCWQRKELVSVSAWRC